MHFKHLTAYAFCHFYHWLAKHCPVYHLPLLPMPILPLTVCQFTHDAWGKHSSANILVTMSLVINDNIWVFILLFTANMIIRLPSYHHQPTAGYTGGYTGGYNTPTERPV